MTAAQAIEGRTGLWLASSEGRSLPAPEGEDGDNKSLTRKPYVSRRKKTTREKDNTEFIGFLRRAMRAATRRVIAEDPSTLAELVAIQKELNDLIAVAARKLHDEHEYSWGDIAYELGITRQAAQQRWGPRRDS